MKATLLAAAAFVAAALAARATADAPAPGKNSATEARAESASLARAGDFLDAVSADWTKARNCGACHTNVPYLMARPAIRGGAAATDAEKLVRKFFEDRVSNWDRGQKGDKPRWDTEVLVTGVTLALHDRATTGKLHAATRQALDRMWTLQKKSGAWDWLKCNWPPMEHDDYFGAAFVAVGVGLAPGDYARTEKAKAGLEKLRAYFQKTPPPSLHHEAWLAWASMKLDGLMTKEAREKTLKKLRALQKADGSWSLASLGEWKGYDKRENDAAAPGDGYGTGLVVYLMRQGGVAADDAAVKKGAAWLKANQRVSGRWFTKSLNTDRYHYITHAGTAFAALALKSCE